MNKGPVSASSLASSSGSEHTHSPDIVLISPTWLYTLWAQMQQQ